MAWQLEIRHIDVVGSGDATLIIAREVAPLLGLAPIIRSALIDGGRRGYWARLHAYVGAHLGAGVELSAMICTHYDTDHVGGLVDLLLQPGLYDHTYIYDQGWPQPAGQDQMYLRYVNAMNGRNDNGPVLALAGVARTRVTAAVRADGVALPTVAVPAIGPPAVPGGGAAAINGARAWLLGGVGAPADPLWNGAGIAPPGGAPTMRFIAANRYVRTPADGVLGPIGGLGVDPKNEKSLAVEVSFGSFRYYVGGDIETGQEDYLEPLLNNADDAAGRVLAFKTSHHGSRTATARSFVNRIRPAAAFISCGTGNVHQHPRQQVINILDGYPSTAVAHGGRPPLPPNRPVYHYLTGYQIAGPPPQTYGGDMSLTGGDPNALPMVIRGHLKLTVTAAQAAVPVRGQLYFAVQRAVRGALTAPLLPGALTAAAAAPIAAAAAEAAVSFGGNSVASAVINAAVGPAAAAIAADNAANGVIPPGSLAEMTAKAVTGAALGAGAAGPVAAGAGAAAGACSGAGDNNSVLLAITGAVRAAGAGIGWAAAFGYGTAQAGLLAPAQPQFRVRMYALFPPHGPGWVTLTHR